ncbi:MAG: tetraacyldisaccharide 4'-kinase [Longimicrobiales bacterium]|nr:tetraacyldisaccharide 4'-kinase [Longimicrobiales bacterium]
MRTRLERFAWRMWRGEAGWSGSIVRFLLLPLEGVWRLATRARNRRHDRRKGSSVEGLTVVSVGNLAVGGTGKTPVSAWVVEVLREAGARPALLLRGYGDDEVRLHRRWSPRVPVEVGPDRLAGARRLRDEGVDVVVLDDGFQHRRLARALDIVLLAVGDRVPGAVLPRGPYREPLEALRRAHVVVVTRRQESPRQVDALLDRLRRADVLSDATTLGSVRLASRDVTPLSTFAGGGSGGGPDDPSGGSLSTGSTGGTATRPSAPAGAASVLAVAAVARPEAFREDVSALTGRECQLMAFSDHHEFRRQDARRIREAAGGRPVYVTEKDAVKLAPHVAILGDVRVVGQAVVWERGEAEVRRRVAAAVDGAEEPTS